MENRALFFRNVNNISELINKTKEALCETHKNQRFKIIKVESLNEYDFYDFQDNLSKTWTFIKNDTHKLIMNDKAEYLCILVKTDNIKYGILVNSNGYTYARNVALIWLGE